MESINESTKQITMQRVGNFTSSMIYQLMSNGRAKGSFGKPFDTYAKEKAMEELIGRDLTGEAIADPLDWGNLCEAFAYDQIEDLSYNLVSKDRYYHLDLPWSGMPDLLNDDTVGDIKCPWTLKSFIELSSAEDLKEASPQYYWQLVSNAILCNKSKAKLFLFMPKKEQIKEVIKLAEDTDSRIKYKSINQLPYLPDESKISSLQVISFDIPDEDKEALTERVEAATKEKEQIFEGLKSKLLCKK
jgi:hypothetical protein